jgi:endopolyphosphatase
MVLILKIFSLLAGVAWCLPPEQKPLTAPVRQDPARADNGDDKPALRELQGRFLHITGTDHTLTAPQQTSANSVTDVHPDAFYKAYTSTDSSCHRQKGAAGALGAEMSSCDTPISLVNATFQWVKDNLKDKIDFVVWTGDSARHDNDEHIPRTETQIVDSNRMLVDKFVEVFGKDDNIADPDPTNDFVVPIVPTFGNNDILPHNIFEGGPNRWTREYADIWRNFIPEAQRHSFARGGWFFTEVVPNKLAVFSLNTMYFFDSNSAVDGCDQKSEPGYEHMDWLRVQLQFLRERGMKAIMIGHVPPARTAGKQNWDETCWQKYSLWMRQYRDVVITGIFGHMNIDHFMFQDAFSLKYKVRGEMDNVEIEARNATDPMFSIRSKADYLTDLRDGWTNLPTPPLGMTYAGPAAESETALKKGKKHKKSNHERRKKFLKDIGGKWAERFSLSLVSPSVVPNYYPTLRVVEYNITGLENEHPAMGRSLPAARDADTHSTTYQDSGQAMVRKTDDEDENEEEDLPTHDLKNRPKKTKHKKHKKKKKKKQPYFAMPKPPSSTSPPGPAYSPQPFTLTSYTQYFANLTFINKDFEGSGLPLDQYIGLSKATAARARKFKYEVEYDTKVDKRYKMQDMTVRSYLDLTHRIVKDVGKRDTKKHILDVLPDGTVVDVGDPSGAENEDLDEVKEDEEEYDERKKGRAPIEDKKKKKKHRKYRKHKKNKDRAKKKLWHTFVKRAFVMTKTDNEMDDFDP